MYKQMRQRVSLDFEKEELSSALKKLARETATNMLVDTRAAKEAKLEVTLQMDDVPLETAVRLMSEMAGLKPVRVGNVLFITTKPSANELRADPDLVQPGGPRSPQEMMQLQLLQQQGFAPAMPIIAGPAPAPVAPVAPGIGAVPVNPPPAPAEEKKVEEKKVEPEKDKETPERGEKPADKPAPAPAAPVR